MVSTRANKTTAKRGTSSEQQKKAPQTQHHSTIEPSLIAKYDSKVDWAKTSLEHSFGKDLFWSGAFAKGMPKPTTARGALNNWFQDLEPINTMKIKRYTQLEVLRVLSSNGMSTSAGENVYDIEWRQLDVNGYPLPRALKALVTQKGYDAYQAQLARRHAVVLGANHSGTDQHIDVSDIPDHQVVIPRNMSHALPSGLEGQLKAFDKAYSYESESDCEDEDFRKQTQPRGYVPKHHTGALKKYLTARETVLGGTPFGVKFQGKKRKHPGPDNAVFAIKRAKFALEEREQQFPLEKPSSKPRRTTFRHIRQSSRQQISECEGLASDFGDDELAHAQAPSEDDWYEQADNGSDLTSLSPEPVNKRRSSSTPLSTPSLSTLSSFSAYAGDDDCHFEDEGSGGRSKNIVNTETRSAGTGDDVNQDVFGRIVENDDEGVLDFGDEDLADLPASTTGDDVWWCLRDDGSDIIMDDH